MSNQLKLIVMVLCFLAAEATCALAGDKCCDQCGQARCKAVCILKCEMKEVEVTCWGCKCDEICVPGPSKIGCKHCESVCNECCEDKCNGPCAVPKKFVWFQWWPCCAKVVSRKRLMKGTIKKKIPSYTWEVKHLCPDCESGVKGAEILRGTENQVPRPPVVKAALKYRKPAG